MSKFSPGHMYDTGAKASTEERELQPLDNGNSQPAISDKEKEALEESAIVPPPTEPRSAITTEGKINMQYGTIQSHVCSNAFIDTGAEAVN